MHILTHWIAGHETLLWWLGAVSILTFVGSLVAIPWLVARIPADYFTHQDRPSLPFFGRHPLVRLAGLVAKNVLGVAFLAAGLAMLVLPGQGILTILIGVSLLNFPGKRVLELSVIRQPTVHQSLNWIRQRAGSPPLKLPPELQS